MQLITELTHKSGNTLDLILVNNERLVHHYTCSKTNLSISHHSIIQSATLFNVSYKTEKEHKPKLLSPFDELNYFSDEVDWTAINSNLSKIDWNVELENTHPIKTLQKIYELILDITKKHILLRTKN